MANETNESGLLTGILRRATALAENHQVEDGRQP